MRSWNTHSWYITGILAALFVGSISVQWNAVKDLPGIVSFALGLSSLLLAVIAIIQSITSGSSAEASLSAVREASGGVQTALGDINKATDELRSICSTMVQSSEASRQEVAELRLELVSKATPAEQPPTDEPPASQEPSLPLPAGGASIETAPTTNIDASRLTFGAAGALYVAIRSYMTKKAFNLKDVFPEDQSIMYEEGVLAGFRALGYIGWRASEGKTRIVAYEGDIKTDLYNLKNNTYTKVSFTSYQERLALVDDYFAEEIDDPET